MTALQKAESVTGNILALLTALADRVELDETIRILARSLADAHGIPASYPPME
jgi:hypothetical protein